MSIKTALFATTALALAAAPAAAQELRSIGVTVGNLGNPFFVQVGEGAESMAHEIAGDDVTITVVSADYDLARQYNQIDNFIASGVDMILLNAADPAAIEPAVRRAQAAGIVVVAVDVAAAGADATVQTNNVEAGLLACQYIAEYLDGTGNVIIMNGPPVSAVIDRVQGCHDALAEHDGIEVLSDTQNGEGTREGGMDVMIGLLSAFDDVDAVFTINDPQAIGADLAAKQLGRTDLIITSVDGAPDIEGALASDTLIHASAAQDPFLMARMAVQVGYEIMQGNPPEEPIILIPANLVTRENVGDYQGWSSE
jgi:ribose transport system substrate-binding protein